MRKNINMHMADGTEKAIAFEANGGTAIRYRMIFHKELIQSITGMLEEIGDEKTMALMKMVQKGTESAADPEKMAPEDLRIILSVAGSGALDIIPQLAYVMNMAAEGMDMHMLSVDGYLDWLERFEPAELILHAPDLIGVYTGNRVLGSVSKKNIAPLTAL